MRPAGGAGVDDGALLRTEGGDTKAQRRVSLRVARVTGRRQRRARGGRTTPTGDRRVDLAVVRRIELDDGKVVELARLAVSLVRALLHREPGVVDERAGLRCAADGH